MPLKKNKKKKEKTVDTDAYISAGNIRNKKSKTQSIDDPLEGASKTMTPDAKNKKKKKSDLRASTFVMDNEDEKEKREDSPMKENKKKKEKVVDTGACMSTGNIRNKKLKTQSTDDLLEEKEAMQSKTA